MWLFDVLQSIDCCLFGFRELYWPKRKLHSRVLIREITGEVMQVFVLGF